MGQNNNIYRIFILGVLALITTSILITILNDGECYHWLATVASILVLYRVVRGPGR